MPATGRAAAGHPSRNQQRSEKTRSAQAPQTSRRESQSGAGAMAQRPGLKNRAYSAPMIPRSRLDGAEQDHMGEMHCEPGEDDEIAGDPFFQRYNFPQTDEPLDREEASSSSADSSSDTEGPLSPTHITTRVPTTPILPAPQSPSGSSDTASAMQDITVAVLGQRGTGKSLFIRNALNLPPTTTGSVFSRKMKIDGGYYIVRFLEMLFSEVHLGAGNVIKWPETVGGLPTPKMDGAIIVYDVMNPASLGGVPEFLIAVFKASLPFSLVACKCDNHPAHRAIDIAVIDQKAKALVGEVNHFQTTDSALDAHKGCLSVMTRAVIAAKRPRSQASTTRRRANSSAVRGVGVKDQWAARKHERANSEFSVSTYRGNDSEVKGHRYKPSDSTGRTFLDLEESPGYDSGDSELQGSDQEQSIMSEMPSNENGYTFDQLVDRLLSQPMSKNDSKFVSIFLALYRRFATPGQLLESTLKHFDALNRLKPPVLRIISQLRYLAILQQWVSGYPGDFAYSTTRRKMRKFASSISSNAEFAVAATEIMRDLELVNEDDDTHWACSDVLRDGPEPSLAFQTVLDTDSEDENEFTRAIGHLSMSSDRLSIARSTMTGTSRTTQSTGASSGSSSHTLLNQVEKNERLAKMLVPNPIKPLSKIQWHQLMNEDDTAIAQELTRIDWIMFSSIRPRDLVRHVSMNAEEKKRCKSLENVNRMIEHFNHVAYLVTNYILLREKPKHRALMLEKWIRIARAVRNLNNYNALGAVLAGIKGTAVHRLNATKELVPQLTNKDFMRMEVLMSPQKSHWAYRLAWENSSQPRIPYIPLHRRDLVSASEGNSTFVGDKKTGPAIAQPHPGVSVFQGAPGNRDSREAPPGGVIGKERINWRKFEIMGEVIVSIQRAQGTPYQPGAKNDEIRNLILDVKILKDDDELYDRSVQLEAAGAGERRRFNWFRER
ncbi:rap guanine nucleotide exchange factor 4 [Amniculicola lignicola CBS 123094]|uniref:Rap guanine nucleotide exchange factor 4 n=1 Tax=Amniculicola lignicola CBS 123094 TaxID=1392246 RepID=A0A6A5WU00_9PLEO|nr:rap guanine nucleotide exchange factor 4 [Amniculicola lignicola CBS 123094]